MTIFITLPLLPGTKTRIIPFPSTGISFSVIKSTALPEWGIEGKKENGRDEPLRPYIDPKSIEEKKIFLQIHTADF